MGEKYLCKSCGYKWGSRKSFGEPSICPSCKKDNIVEYFKTKEYEEEQKELKDVGLINHTKSFLDKLNVLLSNQEYRNLSYTGHKINIQLLEVGRIVCFRISLYDVKLVKKIEKLLKENKFTKITEEEEFCDSKYNKFLTYCLIENTNDIWFQCPTKEKDFAIKLIKNIFKNDKENITLYEDDLEENKEVGN